MTKIKKTTDELRADFFKFLKNKGYENPKIPLSQSALRAMSLNQILHARRILKYGRKPKEGPSRPQCPIEQAGHHNIPGYDWKEQMADYFKRFDFELGLFFRYSPGLLEALANGFEETSGINNRKY